MSNPDLPDDVVVFASRAVQQLRCIADDETEPVERRNACNAIAAGLARSVVPDAIHAAMTADQIHAWRAMDPDGWETAVSAMSYPHLAQTLNTLDGN